MWKVFDAQGQEREREWLWAEFGGEIGVWDESLRWRYGVQALRDSGPDAPAALVVTVRDAAGKGLAGVRVGFYWPDAPLLSSGLRAVVGKTDGNGAVGFGLGRGAYYFPESGRGPHEVFLLDEADMSFSEVVSGLGMLGGTNHRHVNVDFVRRDAQQDPDPEPDPEPVDRWEMVIARLDRIVALLEGWQLGQAVAIPGTGECPK